MSKNGRQFTAGTLLDELASEALGMPNLRLDFVSGGSSCAGVRHGTSGIMHGSTRVPDHGVVGRFGISSLEAL